MDLEKPPYRSAILAGLAVLTLYIVTLAPTTAFWDASEYIATAHILGIPHPPGNSLFVVLGKVWTLLLAPFGLSVAVRVNLFAATTSAMGAAFYFLVAHRVLKPILPKGRRAELGAFAATLIGATAFTVWNQSTVNEKVYTVSMMITAVATWLAFRWYDRRDDPRSLRYLLGAGYMLILGSTNHLMSLLAGPAILVLVLMAKPGELFRKELWVRGVPAVILGLSMNFFLPIRAAQNPVINEGHPVCESAVEAAVAVYSNGRSGCQELADNLSREQYGEREIVVRQAPLGDQFQMYVQYFSWQWARGELGLQTPAKVVSATGLLFLLLGVGGLIVAWGSNRELFAFLLTLTITVTVGLVYYLNFKYGFSLAPEIQDPLLHEVRERDYFFLIGFGLWGVLAGIGLSGIWAWLKDNALSKPYEWAGAAVLLVALVPLFSNWSWASRAGDYAARDWAYNLLMSVEPYGVLFTNGDNDTFPLWYLQEVEEIRQDVTVVVGQYLYTDWYPKQLQELTLPENQRPFVADQGAGVYADVPAPPTSPIITLDPASMDLIPMFEALGSDLTVPMGELAVTYPRGTYLDRGDLLALRMISDSFRHRPIYFAGTTNLAEKIQLSDWGVRHGLAVKLFPRDLDLDTPQASWAAIQGSVGVEWVDVDRSVQLIEEVFQYRSLDSREIWFDEASVGIPYNMAIAHYLTAQAGQALGRDTDELLRIQERGDRLLTTARGGTKIVGDALQGGS